MKKNIITSLLLILLFSSGFPNLAFANSSTIKVFVNGVEIQTDQPPIVRNGRTLVPLRAIFESLNAKVVYEEGTRKITATRGDTRIILYIGFNQAIVNNKQVTLDVPSQVINGRTLVPVRFVSEALGDRVFYDAAKREVRVTRAQSPMSGVAARDVENFGDGRDLEVSFKRAENEAPVSEYRVMVVKTSQATNFNLNTALSISPSNYTVITKSGQDIRQVLTSSTRDTDGAFVENDINYTVFVLQVGNGASPQHHLAKSTPVTLTLPNRVAAVTNVTVRDVYDYGDGRDLEVSFNRLADENHLLYYRAIVVPNSEISQFDLSAAKEVTSGNYTTIFKTGANLVQNLTSTRDYKGRVIQNGTTYRVYILAIGNASTGFGSSLSAPSAQITPASRPNDIRATNVVARDISDHGDGRDLEVTFKIPSQEIRVANYRVMVVPANEVNSFTLQKANSVSSSNYTTVSKTGQDRTVTLASTTRDVNGNLVRSNLNYRLFVLSVGGPANGFTNSLSSPSQTISLTDNFRPASATSIRAYDISDHGDGRDLQVTFNRITDESVLSEYRIMIVKSAQAGGFSLTDANNVPPSNYTVVPKTGANLSRTLTASTRDAFGALIREGVEYRVYVLSVSNGGNSKNNSLSGASAAITLRVNSSAQAVISVTAHDIANAADGSDLEVRFVRVGNEASIAEYRIMVVKSHQAFNLAQANAVTAGNYTPVAKTGSNIVHRLSPTARDVQGDLIKPDIEYKVYVMSVSNAASSNALSNPSLNITLSNPFAGSVSNITASDIANNGNGRDMRIGFTKPTNEASIAYYAILVVPEAEASTFTLAAANLVPKEYFTRVNKTGGNHVVTLDAATTDVRGNLITSNITYRVFVLSIADGINATINGLASSLGTITLD
ncbi:copper amine oxidase N-terminal domain-containing protein [Anaerobacillus alkaliphilus]|uniref:Copper amine oxidase N-terminal domain-containing protein n=1 Tax=Anaerobacillus alkaliphilus TaxID=1548597 RepID=A0A4Q0VVZ2_9BACI|nr:copper amine oxidase N-terminal domain-containing protein [Anaerobacillus alkaliphilus]RXJ01650.1 copper amine oxidase N-terminal domain-containing protein [Anaerobacillus alkaliphilus]